MIDDKQRARLITGGDHCISFRCAGGHRFFHNDCAHPGPGRRDGQRRLGVRLGANRDDIGFDFVEHLFGVVVRRRDAPALRKRIDPFLTATGHGHKLVSRCRQIRLGMVDRENRVKTGMPVRSLKKT